jgi:hypothetical protein
MDRAPTPGLIRTKRLTVYVEQEAQKTAQGLAF